MMTRGRKSNIRLARILAAVLFATAVPAAMAPAAPAGDGDGFLIPGVALSDAVFEVGAWCQYLVVDEIMGEKDSTTVHVAVTGRVERDGMSAWWLEIDSGPAGAPPAHRDLGKALISSEIRSLAPGDSLHQYVSELYVRKGTGPVEPADPANLEQLTLSNPTSDSDWVLTPGESIETAQGRLSCDHKHLVVNDDSQVDMGRITLFKNNTDVFDVWLCDDVPIFRVAKCVIERVRNSRTEPQVPGIPNKDREESRTTVELLAYGENARAKMKVP